MLKLTYICLNLLVQQINSEVFFKLKSNYIEKLNTETKNTLQKRFDTAVTNEIVSGMV